MLRRLMPVRLVLLVASVAVIAAAARVVKPDIVRYLKLREM